MWRVSIGMYNKTVHDVNDGFGGKAGACRVFITSGIFRSWTPNLVQFFNSKLFVALINTESKYRYRQHRMTDPNPGDPHAMLSSTEDTRASQPTQANQTNNHSEDFIPIDKRKWNDITAYGEVRGRTLEYRISKLVASLLRHQDVADREIDGAVRW